MIPSLSWSPVSITGIEPILQVRFFPRRTICWSWSGSFIRNNYCHWYPYHLHQKEPEKTPTFIYFISMVPRNIKAPSPLQRKLASTTVLNFHTGFFCQSIQSSSINEYIYDSTAAIILVVRIRQRHTPACDQQVLCPPPAKLVQSFLYKLSMIDFTLSLSISCPSFSNNRFIRFAIGWRRWNDIKFYMLLKMAAVDIICAFFAFCIPKCIRQISKSGTMGNASIICCKDWELKI